MEIHGRENPGKENETDDERETREVENIRKNDFIDKILQKLVRMKNKELFHRCLEQVQRNKVKKGTRLI